MEKRQCKRFKTRQMAKICGKLAVVNDISEKGVQISTAFSPRKRRINLSFEAYGRIMEIVGIIQWVKLNKQLQSLNQMGVLIKNAPPEYLQLVQQCDK